jgi:hypothetical protein
VRRLVGEAFFAEAARRYLLQAPSADGDLHRFGAGFAQFLAHEDAASSLPWLGDVASLEWACDEALHAQDAAALDVDAIASSGDITGVRLHPSVRRIASTWPVLAIWEANQPDRDGTPARSEGGDRAVVWRDGTLAVRMRALTPQEETFLDALARGTSLSDALEPFSGLEDACLQALVARCASDGFFSAA